MIQVRRTSLATGYRILATDHYPWPPTPGYRPLFLPFPRSEQSFHQIILRIFSFKFRSAVFTDNLVNLKPVGVDLLFVVPAHGNIRRCNRIPGGRVFGEVSVFGNSLFTLYPSCHAHGILFYESVIHKRLTPTLFKPDVSIVKDLLGTQVRTVFLLFFKVVADGRDILTAYVLRLWQYVRNYKCALCRAVFDFIR